MILKQGIFDEFNKYMGTVIENMLSDDQLCRLLYSTAYNPLDYAGFDTALLVNKNIFPYDFVPDITDNATSVINIIIDDIVPYVDNHKFGSFTVQFNILVHNDLWKIENQQLRPFNILQRIDTVFNGFHGIGTTVLSLERAFQVRASAKYSGYACLFNAVEMNQVKF